MELNEDNRGAPRSITSGSLYDYWRTHNRLWAGVDLTKDPEGLANVCHAGAPYYVNRYAAKCQERVFDDFLSLVPHRRAVPRALDVGCGAGRWSKRLATAGFKVTGIDLQPDLLERNQVEFPGIEFQYSSIQDFGGSDFDLVTSITVIQHNPEDEQQRIVRKFRAMLRSGGYALIMENIVDRLPSVFANSVDGWRTLFEENGFQQLALRTYDYRSLQRLMGKRPALAATRSSATPRPTGGTAQRARQLFKRFIVAGDGLLEPAFVAAKLPGATHCAFLYRSK